MGWRSVQTMILKKILNWIILLYFKKHFTKMRLPTASRNLPREHFRKIKSTKTYKELVSLVPKAKKISFKTNGCRLAGLAWAQR